MAVARADAASGGRGACIKLSLAKAPAFPSMFPMATCPPVRRQCLGGRPAGGSEKIVRLPVVLFGRRVGPTAPELGGLVGMSAAGATTHVFESVFQRAVVTSTFVERCFAALTRFSKPPQSCATLAAKHTNATFAQIVEQWRASQGVCAHEQTKSRPAWMQTHVRGFSLNGYQLFARDMKTTSRTMVFMMPTFYSQNNGGLFLQRRGEITVGAQRPSGVAPGVARALWTPCWVASTK